MSEEAPICRLCKGAVVVNRNHYDVFEQMHWLCFHIMFEHFGDPDEPCEDPSCPWRHVLIFRRKLEQLGYDPDDVLWNANE